MIDPISAAGVSSGAGALLGLVGNFFAGRHESEIERARLKVEEEAARSGHIKDYRSSLLQEKEGAPYTTKVLWGLYEASGKRAPRAFTPAFNTHLMLITATSCAAIIICFLNADIPVLHQAVDGTGTSWRIFGIIERTSPDHKVYVLTLGSVGAYLLSVPAFILCAVFTGVVPKRFR